MATYGNTSRPQRPSRGMPHAEVVIELVEPAHLDDPFESAQDGDPSEEAAAFATTHNHCGVAPSETDVRGDVATTSPESCAAPRSPEKESGRRPIKLRLKSLLMRR